MGSEDNRCTAEAYFDGFPEGLALYKAVEDAVAAIGQATVRVTKSQIAFRRRVIQMLTPTTASGW